MGLESEYTFVIESRQIGLKMNDITVMLCFARSGGTLLNRCLGCLPDVTIMSEVNPLGGGWGKEGSDSYTTIKAQAGAWYGIELENVEFASSAVELAGKCEHLIIRDWSFVNFAPIPQNKNKPPQSLLILDELETVCTVKPFAFVRNAIDVYLSRKGSLYDFVMAYRTFAQEIVRRNIPIYHYEEFCIDPPAVFKQLCNYIDVQYRDVFTEYLKFLNVNGDVQGVSRGKMQNMIAPLPRLQIDPDLLQIIKSHTLLQEVNEMLGY